MIFLVLGVRPRIRRQAGNEFIPPECRFEEFESIAHLYKNFVFFHKFGEFNFSVWFMIHMQPIQRFVFLANYIVLVLVNQVYLFAAGYIMLQNITVYRFLYANTFY